MDKQTNIPQVRFPEFKEDWEVKRLEQIGQRITKKNTDFSVSLVLTNSAIKGIINQEDYFDKKIANSVNLNNYYIAEIDDFIYNPRISKSAPVGPLKRNKLEQGVMSPLYTVLRFNNGDFTFLEQYFETTFWHKYLKSIANYGARFDRMNITNESLLKLPIPFPTLPEQKKIAHFFTTLDQKINQLQEKKNGLEQYKKGMMQQIFNQELRFKDENGNDFSDWEKKKLGEVGRIIGGGTPKSSNPSFWEGEIPWISSSDVYENNINSVSISRYITKEALKQSATKLIPKNSILIVSRVGIGKFAVSNQELCTSQDFSNFIPINVDSYFLAYYFSEYKNKFLQIAQGTSIKGFTGKDIRLLKFSIPTSTKEQTKIANFLSKIDDKINAVNQQIAQSKTYKKGLSQKMFVN